ncbi:MAG: putative toxin-antitoxin system toxin component, PIN family [Bacteroidota bacterium]
MRVTLDTNVLIAAFIARGTCADLLEHLVRHHTPAASPFILGEFREKLAGKFKMPEAEVDEAAVLLRTRLEITEPEPLAEPVCRDPDDDAVLAAARGSACLVTGDNDLLVLRRFEGLPILRPSEFWAFEAKTA